MHNQLVYKRNLTNDTTNMLKSMKLGIDLQCNANITYCKQFYYNVVTLERPD